MEAFGRTQTDPPCFLSPAPDRGGLRLPLSLTHSLVLTSSVPREPLFLMTVCQTSPSVLICPLSPLICLSSENVAPLNCVSDYTGDVNGWEEQKHIIFNTRWGCILIQMLRGNQMIFSTGKICLDVTIELKIRSQRIVLRAHVEQRKGQTMPRGPYCPL